LIRTKSTSGGFFSALAVQILRMGGIVFAAGYSDSMNVIHKKATKIDELNDLYGSKYVQSDLSTIFTEIRNMLSKKEIVLFVGTPCQVEGLLHFLGDKKNDLLYTADFVCYGVASPKLYREWLNQLEDKYQCNISYINFRDKKYGYAGVNCKVDFANGKILQDKFEAKSFLKTMFSHFGLRPSCYECQFRSRLKICDFTMGDMWEIGQYDINMDDDRGTTNLQINTIKGKKIFETIKRDLNFCFIDLLSGVQLEEKSRKNAKKIEVPKQREEFFKDSVSMNYSFLIQKYLPQSIKESAASILKPLIVKVPHSQVFFRTLKRLKMNKTKR